MLFVNLNKLTVEKHNNHEQIAVEIGINIDDSVNKVKNIIKESLKTLFADKIAAKPTQYHIEFLGDEIDDEIFLFLVNTTAALFFDMFVVEGSRARERRLDIPEPLQCAHISAGLLKRAINARTVCDVFNITMSCNQLYYCMVDTKETKSNEHTK